MASPAPSVGSRRHQSKSPRRTPKSSPKRRPLHERSDSETNASYTPSLTDKTLDMIEPFQADPFPRLPSQILSPSQEPYIFEDKTATLATGPSSLPALSRTPSPRRGRSKSPRGSSEKGPRPTPASRLPRLSAPPVLKPSVSVSSSFNPLRPQAPSVRRLKEKYEELGSIPVLVERPSRRQLYSPTLRETKVEPSFVSEPVLPSQPDKRLNSEPDLGEEDETVIVKDESSKDISSSTLVEETLELEEVRPRSPPTEAQVNLAKVLQDAHKVRDRRSPSVDSIRTPRQALQDAEKTRVRRSPSLDSIRTPKTSPITAEKTEDASEMFQSASTPVTATEALLRALINSGENIQYPQLRKPSATSLRTDASSIRRAYPAPLRLRRKRAYSDMSAELSTIEPSPTSASTSTGEFSELVRPQPSYRSLISRASFVSSSVHAPAPLRVTNVTYHDTWQEELDDTLTELQPQHQVLRRQRSGYYSASISDISRPTSSSSMRSSRMAFYHFLNDSHTAWARFYYRGEGRLRSPTPPTVIEITPPHTPIATLLRKASSGRSDSPASAGFPESLYVPRIRPLQQDSETVSLASDRTSLVVLPPRSSYIGNESVVDALPQRQPNYLPDIPYLSPSKRKSEQHEPGWTAPSMDEHNGVLSRVNRQIALFSIGFICPFAWMFASFLTLPACPDWRSNTPNFEHYLGNNNGIQSRQDVISAELCESFELRRFKKARWWRRANRYMSLVGVCILIVIIIASSITATT